METSARFRDRFFTKNRRFRPHGDEGILDGLDPLWSNGCFASSVLEGFEPSARLVRLIEKPVDTVQCDVRHRIEMLFVCVPPVFKTRERSVRAVELSPLERHHASLTPCQR